ncbi:MAG: ABC transporter ATP-binding protein [Pseudomonadaceae bacterium]|nr:ABC transporter ATP-binding protein [Pseudomonadaceae bacterium]
MSGSNLSTEQLAESDGAELAPAADASPSILSAHGIGKTVRTGDSDLTILDGIDIEIKRGAALAIVGASGSGKTTLLGILAGLDLPSRGTVTLAGSTLTDLDEEQRALVRGREVGFVFQNFQLLASLSALENVMLPAELRGDSDARAQAESLLARVGLAERTSHYPRQLSGGEQQRVAIARAFASQPSILFADEPTGNLDTKTGSTVIDLLFELNAEFGTTLILVTHDMRLAERCSQQLVLDSGRRVS